jgi:hypothetical protein
MDVFLPPFYLAAYERERLTNCVSMPRNWKGGKGEGCLNWNLSYHFDSESWGNFSVYLLSFAWQTNINKSTRKNWFRCFGLVSLPQFLRIED